MIIGIDGNEANVHEQVGVSVYTSSLLKYFSKKANIDLQFRVYLKHKPNDYLPVSSAFFRYEIVRGKFFWSQIFLPAALFLKRGIDVFFSPAHYTPRFCPVPIVTTIHDLSYFYYPNEFLKKDLYKLTNWTKRAVNTAAKIIAVSKNTKKDLMKFYQISDDKIETVYNGFEKTHNLQMDPSYQKDFFEKWGLTIGNYLLYVGTLQPRKNIATLLYSFQKIRVANPNMKLVLVGRKGWLYEEIYRKTKELDLQNSVLFTGYLLDDEVTLLYKNALCFIMPSFYEGFGIPILEAMSFNCPVISSFTSSLPEIGGDACLYFDPNNKDGLAEKIHILICNETLRKELVKKGRERIKQFSWEKCAEQTLEIIRNTT